MGWGEEAEKRTSPRSRRDDAKYKEGSEKKKSSEIEGKVCDSLR